MLNDRATSWQSTRRYRDRTNGTLAGELVNEGLLVKPKGLPLGH